jgi:hypothetical protein
VIDKIFMTSSCYVEGLVGHRKFPTTTAPSSRPQATRRPSLQLRHGRDRNIDVDQSKKRQARQNNNLTILQSPCSGHFLESSVSVSWSSDGVRNDSNRGRIMRKTLTALLAAATIGAAALPSSAEARWGWGWGGFGVGLATGAIIGGALARPYYPYYGYGYYAPAYYYPPPYYRYGYYYGPRYYGYYPHYWRHRYWRHW